VGRYGACWWACLGALQESNGGVAGGEGVAEREPAASFKNHVMQSGSAGSRTSTGGRSASGSTGQFNGCGRRRKICRNGSNQRLATIDEPLRWILSRVRCIALFGKNIRGSSVLGFKLEMKSRLFPKTCFDEPLPD
jgi:hypothetical protein